MTTASRSAASLIFKRIIASAAFMSSPVADAAHSSFGIVIPTKRHGNFGISFFHLGIAEKAIAMGHGQLTLVSNWAYREHYFYQNETAWRGGVEYAFKSTVALRAGVDESQFSAGIGLQYKGLIIDYAHNSSASASDDFSPATSALSLTYQF